MTSPTWTDTLLPEPTMPPEIPAPEENAYTSEAILLSIASLYVILLLSYLLQRRQIRFIHETIVSVLLGMFIGLLLYLTGSKNISKMVTFDHSYFFNLLLPPIILNSGYDMHRQNFFKNIGSILVFALFGTFISTVVIGLLLHLLVAVGLHGLQLSLLDCIIVGSILSSTDPVTILSLFHQLKVDPKLYAIIFGESLLNDSVAIVLFSTLGKLRDQTLDMYSITGGVVSFFAVFGGSVLIGIVAGLLCAILLKYTRLDQYPSLETCIVVLQAYSSYMLSNAMQFSGIVSLLFCGIIMKHYCFDNLSPDSKHTTKHMFRVLSQLSENFIFIYLGLTLFTKAHLVFLPWLILFTV
ncbi:monovalent cation:H+ antiporter, CPA1 (nhx1), partial [Kappamyces sp. JEL0680]